MLLNRFSRVNVEPQTYVAQPFKYCEEKAAVRRCTSQPLYGQTLGRRLLEETGMNCAQADSPSGGC